LSILICSLRRPVDINSSFDNGRYACVWIVNKEICHPAQIRHESFHSLRRELVSPIRSKSVKSCRSVKNSNFNRSHPRGHNSQAFAKISDVNTVGRHIVSVPSHPLKHGPQEQLRPLTRNPAKILVGKATEKLIADTTREVRESLIGSYVYVQTQSVRKVTDRGFVPGRPTSGVKRQYKVSLLTPTPQHRSVYGQHRYGRQGPCTTGQTLQSRADGLSEQAIRFSEDAGYCNR
jgi:hypothetical protein